MSAEKNLLQNFLKAEAQPAFLLAASAFKAPKPNNSPRGATLPRRLATEARGRPPPPPLLPAAYLPPRQRKTIAAAASERGAPAG